MNRSFVWCRDDTRVALPRVLSTTTSRMLSSCVFFFCFFFASLLIAPSAAAHPLAPSLLEMTEGDAGVYDVRWKTPSLRARGVEVEPTLPSRCVAKSEKRPEVGASYIELFWQVDCGTEGLNGAVLSVAGLERSRTTALVRVVFRDGQIAKALVRADAPEFTVAVGESSAQSYLALGFEHILLGPDHLLFVLGLLLLIVGARKLFGAVTSFTIGHSLTLGFAIMNWIRIPQQVVEVGIAISLVMVALELVRRDQEKMTLLRSRPWLAAFGFGLLHGLGFAGALREAGLPVDEIPFALLFFNLGIEAGQLVFIAVAIGAIALLAKASVRRDWLEWASAYAIGSLAVFWIIERSGALF